MKLVTNLALASLYLLSPAHAFVPTSHFAFRPLTASILGMTVDSNEIRTEDTLPSQQKDETSMVEDDFGFFPPAINAQATDKKEKKPLLKIEIPKALDDAFYNLAEFNSYFMGALVASSLMLNVFGYNWFYSPDDGFQVDTVAHIREANSFRQVQIRDGE